MQIEKDCAWTLDDPSEDSWQTQCGNIFTLEDGTPHENRMIKEEIKRSFPHRYENPSAVYLRHLTALRDEINNHAYAVNPLRPYEVTAEELLVSVQLEQAAIPVNSSEPAMNFYRTQLVALETNIFNLAATIGGGLKEFSTYTPK